MKKLIAIMFTAALAVFGTSPAFAQESSDDFLPGTEAECAESDNVPSNVVCDDEYPLENPEEGTLPDPATTVVTPSELPATGSSGSTGLVQIGGLMLAGGLLVVVASRRRAPAPSA